MSKLFNLKLAITLCVLAIALGCATSARILDEQPRPLSTPAATSPNVEGPTSTADDDVDNVDPPVPTVQPPLDDETPVVPPPISIPAVKPESPVIVPPPPVDDESPIVTPPPVDDVSPIVTPPSVDDVSPIVTPPSVDDVSPIVTPVTTVEPGHLSFYMHDILGGTHPSARVVTGIIASSEINGIPFSKPNNNLFPLTGGTPLLNNNNLNNMINSNNLPFLTGLNGGQQASTIIQGTGNKNNAINSNNQPFVTAGNLPSGSTLETLMFGSITVIDDQLTEGSDLESAVIGKAQGFYMASSLDGTSQTIALTALFHGDKEHDMGDSISFFGVHRTAQHGSQIAIVGGCGKYDNAKGYAMVETLPQEDQHTTDGVDTIMHFTVYLTE